MSLGTVQMKGSSVDLTVRSGLKDQPGFLAIGHTVFKILSYMERLPSVPRASAGSTVLCQAFHCPDCSTGKGVKTAGQSSQASQVAKRGLAATCRLAPILTLLHPLLPKLLGTGHRVLS